MKKITGAEYQARIVAAQEKMAADGIDAIIAHSHEADFANMTFQVDTFLAAANFGLRWENGIHVTEDGCDMLSKYKTELIEID